jgi:hypothetical protein
MNIAFDPTLSNDSIFNADKWDNLNRGKEEHSLGGQVHGGLYDALSKAYDGNLYSQTMSEVIGGVLYDYAYRNEQDLQVNFTGFSKGGAQAALAAGEMVATDIFEDYPNIKLNNVYAFAPPGYGDQDYIDAFEAKAEQLGTNAWTIELHGDVLPTILTPAGGNYFTQYDYNQFGSRVYLTNTADGIQINENPNPEELAALRAAPVDGNSYHNTKSYVDAMVAVQKTESANANTSSAPDQEVTRAAISQTNTISPTM